MKRRGMATVLAGTMVLSMLGGFAVQADEESYDPITIQFWNGWTGSDGQVLMEYVDKFNETNKWNITVEMDMSSEFRDKITTAMAADAAPALILGNAADKYTYDGKLRKLDEIWDNTDIKKEDFVSSYLDSLSTDDGLYGVPFQISSSCTGTKICLKRQGWIRRHHRQPMMSGQRWHRSSRTRTATYMVPD